MPDSEFQLVDTSLRLISPILVLLACASSGLFEIGLSHRADSASCGFRTIAGTLVPPSAFFLLGSSIADWPLATSSGYGTSLGCAVSTILGGGILTRSLRHRIRIQPLLLALERFLIVIGAPFRDDGHLGLLSLASVAFALSYFVGRPKPTSPQAGDADNPGLAALGSLFLLWGWALAGIGGATSTEDAGQRITCLLVASGTSFFGSVCASLVRFGTIPQSAATLAPLSGLLACLPVASMITVQTSAMVGILGAIAAMGCDHLLRRTGLNDTGGTTPAHAGGALAGLVASPILAASPSLPALGLQFGVSLCCASSAFLGGMLLWAALGLVVRLAPSDDEMGVGLDFTEHGWKRAP
jgi:hypothetical protein